MIELKKVDNPKELAKLASLIWHEYWTEILSPEQIDYMINKFQSENAINEQIKNEKYEYFYILSDNQKAGYIGLSQKDNYLFLSKMYIMSNFRHKGIGTKAFDLIKDYTNEKNYNKIILTVNKYNVNTISAYTKWGFKIIDAVVTDIGQGFVMDDYIMQYDL